MSHWSVRPAEAADAAGIARVHVESWRQTYRGLMADDVLDDPGALGRRLSFWTTLLVDGPTHSDRAAWVAVAGGDVIGFALAREPRDADARWSRELYALYVLVDYHGTGVGGALLTSALAADASAGLWVAEQNPRKIAFYSKHGFSPDGARDDHGGVAAVRLTRRS